MCYSWSFLTSIQYIYSRRFRCLSPSSDDKGKVVRAVAVPPQHTALESHDRGEVSLLEAVGLREPLFHIVLVARLALLLSRNVNFPRESCTSSTLAVQGSAALLSRLLSTTVIYMPRRMTPSLSSMSLPGDPGVSRSSSSQMDSPSATVDAPSVSSSESEL